MQSDLVINEGLAERTKTTEMPSTIVSSLSCDNKQQQRQGQPETEQTLLSGQGQEVNPKHACWCPSL
jgi:hypothetical protein